MFWKYLIAAVVAYCLGNINIAIIGSNLFFKKDIRHFGSNNAGTTNAFRVFGWPFGTTVMLFDIGKGVLACYLGAFVIVGDGSNLLAIAISGLFAAIGHIYPAVFGFRGGKGVATIGGMLILLDWRMFLCMLAVFILLLITTKYMSIASLSTTITGPLSAFVLRRFVDQLPSEQVWMYVGTVFFFGLLLVFTHRENIKRLINGTENRLGKKKKDA